MWSIQQPTTRAQSRCTLGELLCHPSLHTVNDNHPLWYQPDCHESRLLHFFYQNYVRFRIGLLKEHSILSFAECYFAKNTLWRTSSRILWNVIDSSWHFVLWLLPYYLLSTNYCTGSRACVAIPLITNPKCHPLIKLTSALCVHCFHTCFLEKVPAGFYLVGSIVGYVAHNLASSPIVYSVYENKLTACLLRWEF